MPVPYTPIKIGKLRLKNRFVRSATFDAGADRNGHVTPWQIDFYDRLSRGGAGLLVTGLASVHPSGRIAARQNVVSEDGAVAGLRRLVKTVHRNDTRIALQLAHCGREAHIYQQHKGGIALAPSVVSGDPHCPHPHRALTAGEIETIAEAFGSAAARAQAAGFDAVQVHAAHGYLVSQFLSPYTNRRDDRWGGSAVARVRFLEALYQSIRHHVGPDYPVLIKLGVADAVAGGMTFADGLALARLCFTLGFDALEISQGLRGHHYEETEFRSGIDAPEREAYFGKWCSEICRQVPIPVIMVGGLRSVQIIRDVIADRRADLVALSRPLVREPDLVERWRRGDVKPSRCTSCNGCFQRLLDGRHLACVPDAASENRQRRCA